MCVTYPARHVCAGSGSEPSIRKDLLHCPTLPNTALHLSAEHLAPINPSIIKHSNSLDGRHSPLSSDEKQGGRSCRVVMFLLSSRFVTMPAAE